MIQNNDVLKILRSQSTTRRGEFSRDPVASETLDAVKEAMLQTANASNRQSTSVVVLDHERAEKLKLPGDRVMVFCIDFHRLNAAAGKLEQSFDSRYFMQFVTALIDASLMLQSAVVAAQSLGLGTLITNEIYHGKMDEAFKLLRLPRQHVFPVAALCLGHKKTIAYKKQKGRLSPDFVFHDNEYTLLTEERIACLIKEFDDPDRSMGLLDNWQEKGFDHYLQWFFSKWCNAIGTRAESDALLLALKDRLLME